MSETLQIRVHGDASLPTLVYLPGLHGDWTLVGSFRKALAGRVRFVEFTYPRTLTWSLDDHAAGVESALAANGISRAWLLGESFGTQIMWAIAARKQFQVEGLILAGGFVNHPVRWAVPVAERIGGSIPLSLVTWILFGYAKVARLRFRHSPEVRADIQEFIARRTEPDRQAAVHRLRLIARSDFSSIAQDTRLPVYAIAGCIDPVVPWMPVRRWLRRQCPALREYKILWTADHNVLGTAPQRTAELVLGWMKEPA